MTALSHLVHNQPVAIDPLHLLDTQALLFNMLAEAQQGQLLECRQWLQISMRHLVEWIRESHESSCSAVSWVKLGKLMSGLMSHTEYLAV